MKSISQVGYLQIQGSLIGILKSIFLHLREKEISADTLLFNGGVALNSTQMIELTLALESQFNIDVEPDDLTPENFQTVDVLSRLIQDKYLISVNDDSIH